MTFAPIFEKLRKFCIFCKKLQQYCCTSMGLGQAEYFCHNQKHKLLIYMDPRFRGNDNIIILAYARIHTPENTDYCSSILKFLNLKLIKKQREAISLINPFCIVKKINLDNLPTQFFIEPFFPSANNPPPDPKPAAQPAEYLSSNKCNLQ